MAAARLFFSLLIVAMCGVAVAGLALTLSIAGYYGQGLPNHMSLATYVPQTGSEIVAADGDILAKHADQRRYFVPFAKIPPAVVQAFISAEDKNYWGHHGIDPIAIVRAAVLNASSGRSVGASTITQQVAKNLIVGDEKSLSRKIREAMLAMRMDRDLGKQRVLELYLNEIYLGAGAYGVAAAADAYFSKTLDQLSIGEIALIAAMPKAPSAFDPRNNPARALERRNYVLDRMGEDGVLPPDVVALEKSRPIVLHLNIGSQVNTDVKAGWFEDNAWASVQDYVKPGDLAKTDVVVKTTLVPQVQNAAVAALRKGIISEDHRLGWRGVITNIALPVDWSDRRLIPPAGSDMFVLGVVDAVDRTATVETQQNGIVTLDAKSVEWTGQTVARLFRVGDVILMDLSGEHPQLAQMPDVEGAFVALDPRNGDVLALVGGFSRDRSAFDRVTQARRQAGSAFKPIVYLTALTLGYDATSPLLDAPITLEQGPGQEDWRPSDAKSAGKGGLITLRRALELSRNMASVRLLWDIGIDDVGVMSKKLGIDLGSKMTYALGLGAGEVSPMQLAVAYATMANGGLAVQPRYVTSIEAKDGATIAQIPSGQGQQIVDPIAAAQIISMMHGVVERGTAKQAFEGFPRPFAGKTGTTNDSRDAWFGGASSDLVVVAWIGRDDNQPLANGASGGMTAATIVRNFLDVVGDRFALGDPPVPEGVEMMTVDPATGLKTDGQGLRELVRVGSHPENNPPPVDPALATDRVPDASEATPVDGGVPTDAMPDDAAPVDNPPDLGVLSTPEVPFQEPGNVYHGDHIIFIPDDGQ